MLEDAPDRLQPGRARLVNVVGVGQEGVLLVLPERDVRVTAVGRDAHERLRHEAGEDAELATDLFRDLAERREVVRGLLCAVEAEVELDLARRVLVVALDHVEPELLPVLHHLVDDRLELGELVDVVAVGLGDAFDRGLAIGAQLEPHHLGLHPRPQVHARPSLELLLDAVQVPAGVRGEYFARPLAILPVAEARAPDPGDARIPGQHLERLRLRYPDELPSLRAVADVVAMAVDEEVRRRAVDELEALLGDRLPVGRRNALAHDAAGHGGELVVDVGDAFGVDSLPNVLHPLSTSFGFDEALQVGRHHASSSPASEVWSCGSLNSWLRSCSV